MKKKLFIIYLILAFFFCTNMFATKEDYWMYYAEKLDILKEYEIKAIAIAENNLYVATGPGKNGIATGIDLYLVDLNGYSIKKVTQKIIKEDPRDEITEILTNPLNKEIWIRLTNIARCYNYDLSIKQSPSNFLNDRLEVSEKMKDSIGAFDLDKDQAVVGFFKGNIYLYTINTKKYQMVYELTDKYNWALSAVLTKTTAYVATRGDGLIVIDRKTGTAEPFFDTEYEYIQSLAVYNNTYLYIGSTNGLYKIKISDIINR